ncbi:MAG: hypothetical protein CM15mP129_02600 [Chloroflexota bacterium]|nr:MAG: hypothetical protein CM15mP129_02600 [Chloroflexota bacterium]
MMHAVIVKVKRQILIDNPDKAIISLKMKEKPLMQHIFLFKMS